MLRAESGLFVDSFDSNNLTITTNQDQILTIALTAKYYRVLPDYPKKRQTIASALENLINYETSTRNNFFFNTH